MILTLESHYGDSPARVFRGTAAEVREALVQALPWLGPEAEEPLEDVLEYLDGCSAYSVHVEAEPDDGHEDYQIQHDPAALTLEKGEASALLGQEGWETQWELLCEAARFLSRKHPDEASLRRALYDCGDDFEAAALSAHGLQESDRPDLVAVARGLYRPEAGELNKAEVDVEALEPRSEDLARRVHDALVAGRVQDFRAGGRHSKGMRLVRLDGQETKLLKPGSGKQSPASGARQDPSSQSVREACFYAVAQTWGLAPFLPRADLLFIGGEDVAVLDFLGRDYQALNKIEARHPGKARQLLMSYLRDGTLHRWAVLDYILGQTDRHGQNLQANQDSGDVKLIDHGSAFAGTAFDPAQDQDSFVPYYLRVWGPAGNFNALAPVDKLKVMPRLPQDQERLLAQWIRGLHADALAAVLQRFGIQPGPELERLARVRALTTPVDAGINGLWVTPRS